MYLLMAAFIEYTSKVPNQTTAPAGHGMLDRVTVLEVVHLVRSDVLSDCQKNYIGSLSKFQVCYAQFAKPEESSLTGCLSIKSNL